MNATADITSAELPLRPELAGVAAYGAPQLRITHRLNVNENPYPPSSAMIDDVAAAASEAMTEINRYPERGAEALRAGLASYLGHGLDGSRIWVANGSNEVMHQILSAFGGPGRSMMSFEPAYSMYPEYARDTHTAMITVPRAGNFTLDLAAALAAIATHQPAIVMIASPNNPTGTATSLDELAALCEAAPGMVVVDEAYQEFTDPGTPSALELLPRFGRLIVTRTMSKAFALAGARLGYAAAAPAVIDALRVVGLPYHLSSITQATARVALRYQAELLSHVAALRAERDQLVTWLAERGCEVAPSAGNFVLFGRFADRHAVWQQLLSHDVLIREIGPPGWLRVSAGTPTEMAAFRAALSAVLANQPERINP